MNEDAFEEPFANLDEIEAGALKMRELQANEARELHELRTFPADDLIEAIVQHGERTKVLEMRRIIVELHESRGEMIEGQLNFVSMLKSARDMIRSQQTSIRLLEEQVQRLKERYRG